jgi:hypothetical protein
MTVAVVTLIDPEAGRTTSLLLSYLLFDDYLSYAFLIAAILSLVPMCVPMKAHRVHLYLWPQQFLLLMMSLSVLISVYQGHYADGTVKPGNFIFSDQCAYIYLAIGHLIVTWRNKTYYSEWKKI